MTEQPDHLDIAVGLGFQAAAGAGTVQITVDVELQQISRRVARTTRRLRHRADKPKRREVQPVDKCLDEPHRIVSSDVIVNRLRQEEQLRTVVTGKVCHAGFYRTTKDVGIPHIEFSHSLTDLSAKIPVERPVVRKLQERKKRSPCVNWEGNMPRLIVLVTIMLSTIYGMAAQADV